jgi:hypothetical protein
MNEAECKASSAISVRSATFAALQCSVRRMAMDSVSTKPLVRLDGIPKVFVQEIARFVAVLLLFLRRDSR